MLKDKVKKNINNDSNNNNTLSVPVFSINILIFIFYNNLSNILAFFSILIKGSFSVLNQDHWFVDNNTSSYIYRNISLFIDYQKKSAGLPIIKTTNNTSIQGEG